MSSFWKIMVTLSAILVCGLLAERVLRFNSPDSTSRNGPQSQAALIQDEFARVAAACAPAVVVVKTGRRVSYYSDPYSQLYDYFYHGRRPRESTVPTGIGSGFFVTSDGYILTNYHIVRNQDYFRVILYNRNEFEAELVGSDPLSDLAVLKIRSPEPVPFLEFADSDKVKVGHWAIAIGAPFSLAHTVTVGIVSHRRRTMGLNVYENFIQTDASINQGNSGGPLLDLNGKVIGINDFILTPSAGSIGLSFAIAGNLAGQICSRLMRDGRVKRSWLGFAMAELPFALKEKLKIDEGVWVGEVWNGGPAERAGVRTGDVVVSAAGKKMTSPADLQLLLVTLNPGDKIKLLINRHGELLDVVLTAESLPVRP